MSAWHTPGPWRLMDGRASLLVCGHRSDAQASYIVIGSTALHFRAPYPEGRPFSETDYANARLIAAAPDLLAACQRLIAFCSRRDGSLGSFDDWITTFIEDGSTLTECVTRARAAIAKADGSSAPETA
jgi:hypothetical protein